MPPDDDEPPPGLRAAHLPVGEQEVVVFSFPAPTSRAPSDLSGSEQEILRHLLAGHDNATIARYRGTSPRTVSKQVAAIYRKLGVHSRAELASRLG